jgi:hypothetical protein
MKGERGDHFAPDSLGGIYYEICKTETARASQAALEARCGTSLPAVGTVLLVLRINKEAGAAAVPLIWK